ncbi:hypothetical protein LEP1GSC151_1959 [Leptospira interrogans serovar Grippotyphosa str. LT2186]|uniref:Uncharacterized protein n=1 Tax=Leptospira interrogans serovar Grippotyphosa str. LT2186 TaxID=1001599 RepID=M3FY18_LEPIR|nr:hypothetical protein LEP1GSC097_2782 [Leptospira interrogans serovar Grippotyphosa str. UI 08368]EMG12449.1 hypothetical protein LEP1GSC151_1959 [Leptospira interrogans serovar Grippotyphosa str. LT2186]EMN85362.1 hypothetical protein LEP1GSC107_3614 [Leptospira interrogans serovar Grippotyphosa str. UI 12769]
MDSGKDLFLNKPQFVDRSREPDSSWQPDSPRFSTAKFRFN